MILKILAFGSGFFCHLDRREIFLKKICSLFCLIKEVNFFSKPAVAGITFFCLETKEPKVQAIRIASGQHLSQCAWAVTLQVAFFRLTFLSDTSFISCFLLHCDFNERRNLPPT